MKKFESPEIKVILFNTGDEIATGLSGYLAGDTGSDWGGDVQAETDPNEIVF